MYFLDTLTDEVQKESLMDNVVFCTESQREGGREPREVDGCSGKMKHRSEQARRGVTVQLQGAEA